MAARLDSPDLLPGELMHARLAETVLACTLERRLASEAGSGFPSDHPSLIFHGPDGRSVSVELKAFRRRFKPGHEREAFDEQLAIETGMSIEEAPRFLRFFGIELDHSGHMSERLDAALCSMPVSRLNDNSMERLAQGGFKLYGPALWSFYFEQVVVLLPTDTSSRRIVKLVDNLSPSTQPARFEVRVVSRTEAFRLKTYKLAALKRSVMVLRTLFAKLHGLAHAAVRSLAPPGQFVTASPHRTRGPNVPQMTANPVICGMSFAFA